MYSITCYWSTRQYIEELEKVLVENKTFFSPFSFCSWSPFFHYAPVVKTWFETQCEFDLFPWPQNSGPM